MKSAPMGVRRAGLEAMIPQNLKLENTSVFLSLFHGCCEESV